MQDWYPPAVKPSIPTTNYTTGRAGHTPVAVVLHVTDGSAGSAVQWFKDARAKVSAHFLIGRAGEVWQFVALSNTAHANGLTYRDGKWIDPNGNVVVPPWPYLRTHTMNPNLVTISIEHEGKPSMPWTPAMRSANAKLLQWIQAQAGIVYRPLDTLIGHCHIGPLHRANCPGPFVDYAVVAAAGNAAASDVWLKWGTNYPLGESQRNYSIPKLWREHADRLGEARSYEKDADDFTVIQTFQGGWIVFEKLTGRTHIQWRTRDIG